MARNTILTAAALMLLAAGVAEAAPKKAELFGSWEVAGSDPAGGYTGSVWISDAGARQVKLNASLRYDNGSYRRWSSTGWYAFGRIYVRYDLTTSAGLAGGVSGTSASATRISCIYTPAANGLNLAGKQYDGSALHARETLQRSIQDLVTRYQVSDDDLLKTTLAMEIGQRDDPKTIDTILEVYGINGIQLEIDAGERDRQKQLSNAIPFHTAFLYAVESFQEDGDDSESPRGLILEDVLTFLALDYNDPRPPAVRFRLTTRVRHFMRLGKLRLLATTETPEGGESVQQNWIFSLTMDDYSDHGHWAVIDRAGQKKVFNYGFN